MVVCDVGSHCGLNTTRWRHNGQRGGGDDAGSTPRPDTQPLMATRRQRGGSGNMGSTPRPDTQGQHGGGAMWVAHCG